MRKILIAISFIMNFALSSMNGAEFAAKASKYYETLGLNIGASDNDVKKAWKKLILEKHPDKVESRLRNEGKDITSTESKKVLQQAKEDLQKINEAYEVLTTKQLPAQEPVFAKKRSKAPAAMMVVTKTVATLRQQLRDETSSISAQRSLKKLEIQDLQEMLPSLQRDVYITHLSNERNAAGLHEAAVFKARQQLHLIENDIREKEFASEAELNKYVSDQLLTIKTELQKTRDAFKKAKNDTMQWVVSAEGEAFSKELPNVFKINKNAQVVLNSLKAERVQFLQPKKELVQKLTIQETQLYSQKLAKAAAAAQGYEKVLADAQERLHDIEQSTLRAYRNETAYYLDQVHNLQQEQLVRKMIDSARRIYEIARNDARKTEDELQAKVRNRAVEPAIGPEQLRKNFSDIQILVTNDLKAWNSHFDTLRTAMHTSGLSAEQETYYDLLLSTIDAADNYETALKKAQGDLAKLNEQLMITTFKSPEAFDKFQKDGLTRIQKELEGVRAEYQKAKNAISTLS